MEHDQKLITRKQALKTLGGLALSVPVMASPFSRGVAAPEKATAPAVTPKRRRARGGKPNILWITAEGVPLSVLGCYGSRVMQTPHIDRIAKEGMLFKNSFCTNALCAPSRATLLTGKYDHLNGMLTNPRATVHGELESRFDPTQMTFPKLLQKAGYQTGLVGKWHLTTEPGKASNPGDAGFDYFRFKNGAGGPYYNEKGYLGNPSLGSKEIVDMTFPGYITDNFTDMAIEGMKKMKEPFCMTVQFFNAHRPFDPPHPYEHLYDDVRFPEPGTFWDDYRYRSAAAREAHMRISDMEDFSPPKELSSRQRQQWSYQRLMRRFLGTLKSQDDNVGRLLDFLDASGLSDNTIVVYTGDHGFFLGEHGWFDKRFMYEEALRVPWLIRYPGVVKPGSVTDAWVSSIDNAPTALSFAGLPVPGDMQGRSLLPVLKGQTPADWPRSLYYHYYEFAPPHFVLPNYGIRTERYKLISYYTINEWELFDLERDPDEMESLMEMGGLQVRAGYEDVLKDLLEQLKKLRTQYKDTTGSPVHFWPRRSYN
jgi:arylsulfatase A-like enzyme